MSGFEVFGAVTGVITVVEAAIEIRQNLVNACNAPQAFTEVGNKLPLVRNVLRTIEEAARQANNDSFGTNLIPLVNDCKSKAEQIIDILRQSMSMAQESGFQRFMLAMKQPQLNALLEALMKDIYLLAAHNTICGAPQARADEVLNSIRNLIAAHEQASNKGSTYNNWNGTQTINNGPDNSSYHNTGTGQIYVGQTMNFSSNH
jgi:hypothetical protein